MSNPIKLYNFPKSGHAHRIELMLSLLNLPTEPGVRRPGQRGPQATGLPGP